MREDEWPDFAFTWMIEALDDLVPCELDTRLGSDR
jgi:hypothetical protein